MLSGTDGLFQARAALLRYDSAARPVRILETALMNDSLERRDPRAEATEAVPETRTTAGQLARRRVLKGVAAGLPAFLTLANGASAAAASITCLDKRTFSKTQVPGGVTPVIAGTDNWARYATPRVVRYSNGSTTATYYFDDKASPQGWRDYANGNFVVASSSPNDISGLDAIHPAASGWTSTELSTGNALGWIDNSGNPRALGPNGFDMPASVSCMTSIMPPP